MQSVSCTHLDHEKTFSKVPDDLHVGKCAVSPNLLVVDRVPNEMLGINFGRTLIRSRDLASSSQVTSELPLALPRACYSNI